MLKAEDTITDVVRSGAKTAPLLPHNKKYQLSFINFHTLKTEI